VPAVSWRRRSFRFWLTCGLALAILPLALSTVLGYLLFDRGVIASFADVADRQRNELGPAYRLRTALMETAAPVDEFVDSGDATQPPAYRALRERIEVEFAGLHGALQNDPEPRDVVERARADWTTADAIARELLSVRHASGDARSAESMERFDSLIESAVDKLGAVTGPIETDVAADHEAALRFHERSEWVAGIAIAVSGLAMLSAVVLISRILTGSVDRLVAGAERFAAGDRDHRIDVQVPPELHSVAEEFNRMIVRIHESETALGELARRDGLTKLLNRRAFDDAVAEAFERLHRFGEAAALLLLDLDHFKRVNDTHGHAVGDEMLILVAKTVTAGVRAIDRAFRIGGEEFAVLLSGSDVLTAKTTAERIRHAIAAIRVQGRDGPVSPTVSIGLATTATVRNAETLVADADTALYQAKAEGRDRVVTA
jgi:diguanylate cyclase (GGDEF)-like protein